MTKVPDSTSRGLGGFHVTSSAIFCRYKSLLLASQYHLKIHLFHPHNSTMKVLVFLLILCYCEGAVILAPKNPDDLGAAVTFNNQDVLGQYNFGYSEGHPSGSSFRSESGDAFGNKMGSFGLRDADGRVRIVRYVADANGFRADVTSNEPGVAPQDPASATINKPLVVPVALPPPPPPPAPVVAVPKPAPPPPVYNYVLPAPVVAPPPPPAYYPPPPRVALPAPVPAPVAVPAPYAVPAPVPYGPVPVPAPAPLGVLPKNFAAFAPAPPPPAYYTNLVGGKNYAAPVRSFVPPFAAVPPQYGYLKAPPAYQAFSYPL